MILLVDVGNTNIVIGVYKENECIVSWRISTDTKKTSDEYSIQVMQLLNQYDLNPKEVKGIIISSVVPNIMHSLENMVRKSFNIEPIVVGPGVKTGINIRYDNPKEVGADRIVNSVAAHDCKNTITSMQAGILYGYIGQVEYIVRRMKREMNELGIDNPYVIATGGLANLIAKETDIIDKVDSSLTLEGLRIIYEKNKE